MSPTKRNDYHKVNAKPGAEPEKSAPTRKSVPLNKSVNNKKKPTRRTSRRIEEMEAERMGRAGLGHAEAGRAEASRVEHGRTESGRAELGRTEAGQNAQPYEQYGQTEENFKPWTKGAGTGDFTSGGAGTGRGTDEGVGVGASDRIGAGGEHADADTAARDYLGVGRASERIGTGGTGDYAGEEAGHTQVAEKDKRGISLPWLIATIVLIVVAMTSFLTWWDRWVRYDDTADIQGTWVVAQTGARINITDDKIQLSVDAEYEYEIDDLSKTITFSFIDLSGNGRYRFGADRKSIVIVEGGEYTTLSTLQEDFLWRLTTVFQQLIGGDVSGPETGFEPSEDITVTLFVRADVAATVGTTGASGDSGTSGTSGASGTTGTSGTSGAS